MWEIKRKIWNSPKVRSNSVSLFFGIQFSALMLFSLRLWQQVDWASDFGAEVQV